MNTREITMNVMRAGATCAALACWAAGALAQQCPGDLGTIAKGKLTMSINATTPPTQFIDETGKFKGLNIDLGNELAKRLCLEPAYVNIAFEAHIPGLQSGRWDMIDTSLYYTVERSKIMHLIPYGVQALALIAPAGNPKGIAKPEDLAGKAVGVEIAGFEERNLREINAKQVAAGLPAMTIRVFNTYGETFQALQAGQVDSVFAGDASGRFYQEKGRFTMAATGLLPGTPQALATVNPKLAQAVVDALNAMNADGTFGKLMEAWGATKADQWKLWPGSFKFYYAP